MVSRSACWSKHAPRRIILFASRYTVMLRIKDCYTSTDCGSPAANPDNDGTLIAKGRALCRRSSSGTVAGQIRRARRSRDPLRPASAASHGVRLIMGRQRSSVIRVDRASPAERDDWSAVQASPPLARNASRVRHTRPKRVCFWEPRSRGPGMQELRVEGQRHIAIQALGNDIRISVNNAQLTLSRRHRLRRAAYRPGSAQPEHRRHRAQGPPERALRPAGVAHRRPAHVDAVSDRPSGER
jgi:hypothetical protein